MRGYFLNPVCSDNTGGKAEGRPEVSKRKVGAPSKGPLKLHLTPKYICSSNKCLCCLKKVGAFFILFERLIYLCAVKVEKYLAQVAFIRDLGRVEL